MSDDLLPLTESELDEIEDRLDQVTPGPWVSSVPGYVDTVHGSAAIIAMTYSRAAEGEHPLPSAENAEFIAHARTDLPRLIAEVRRQRAELERLRDFLPTDESAELPVSRG